MSDVVKLGRKVEKQHVYRKHDITITYLPAKRVWRWQIVYTVRKSLGREADSYTAALHDAKKFVDRMLDQ